MFIETINKAIVIDNFGSRKSENHKIYLRISKTSCIFEQNMSEMLRKRENISNDRLRSYSSAFSRIVFSDIANFSDFSHLDWMVSHYNEPLKNGASYMDYLSYIYSVMSKAYRNEYVFKNEIINQLLIKRYGTEDTIALNEFRVGDSIVDLAMMNGESKAFEIKTSLDSPKRLRKQMNDYKRLFNKCYVVVDAEECDYYAQHIEDSTGIVSLKYEKGRIVLKEYRGAAKCETIDADCMMKCLRTSEFSNMVESYFGELPQVSPVDMFEVCKKQMRQIPSAELNRLFLAEVKKRSSATGRLKFFPKEIRQIMLALNLSQRKQDALINNLNKPIKRNSLCIVRI